MGQELLNMIIQVSVFMICARMILHLRIKASGEKYIKGIVGLMIIAFMVTSMTTKWKSIRENEILPDIEKMENRMEEMMQMEVREMERIEMGKKEMERSEMERSETESNGLNMGNKLDSYIDSAKEKMIMDAIEDMQEENNKMNTMKEAKEEISISVEQTTVVIGKDRE